MLWYVKSRKDLLFLDTADRVPSRTVETIPVIATAHVDKVAAEVEAVGVFGTARSRGPIEAVVVPIVVVSAIVVEVTSSREKYLRCTIEVSVISTEITTRLTVNCYER